MNKIVKYFIIFIILLLIIFVILVAIGEKEEKREKAFENPITVLDDVDSSPVFGEKDGLAAIQEEGWSTPVKLPVSDEGREDSTQITRDGRYVLFYYDPTVGTFQETEEGMGADPKIYFTERPFVTKQIHPISTDDINAEAGPYISEAGDIYYTKTFIVLKPTPHEATPKKTVMNDGKTIIDMGTGQAEGNPHYCDAMDELYANIVYESGDQDIAVFKNGKTTFLPEPINLPGEQEFQPFLTDDCQTMYFTSTRGSANMFPLQVYKSQRLGEFDWGEPELFISFPQSEGIMGGVGEFTMTRDGKQMVFLELIITQQGEEFVGQNEMYYAEKIN
tara:strand:+ start:59 stop:1057 length:999 start_codon:yes stop_codon:yes gene_type:complete